MLIERNKKKKRGKIEKKEKGKTNIRLKWVLHFSMAIDENELKGWSLFQTLET